MEKAARIISYIFHPAFLPLFLIWVLFNLPIYINYKLSDSYKWFVYGVVMINLVLAPLAVSFYLRKRGYVDSLLMPKVEQRVLPYFLTSVFYILTYFLFERIQFPALYLSMFKAATLVVVVLFVLSTLRYKISAHMAALGGVVGALILFALYMRIDALLSLAIVIVLSGIVASSRYFLKAHSFSEITSGFIVGLGMQLLIGL